MRKLVVIGDEYVAAAYRMLGAHTIIVHDPREMLEKLQELLDREDVGFILVAGELVDPVKEEFQKYASRLRPPIISVLPTLKAPGEPVDMRKLLMRALGVGG